MQNDLRDRLLAIPWVEESPSMFSERPALWVNGEEIVHEEAEDVFDIRLTRGVIRELRHRLRADRRVQLRASSSSDWIEVSVGRPEDEALLIDLVRRAAEAHRPARGVTPVPPPEGRDLERRRRFH